MYFNFLSFLIVTYLATPSLEREVHVKNSDSNPLSDLTFQLIGSNLLWPNDSSKNIYEQSGRYKPSNVIVTRAQISKERAFVALPRYKQGVPFTLGTFNLNGQSWKHIAPYPSLAKQEEGNCDALQSVVDIVLDSRGLLWALDTGIVNSLEQPIRRCGPKIVVIDTNHDREYNVIDLSPFVASTSRLQFLLVDYGPNNNMPFIYVADAGTHSILVYNLRSRKGYSIYLPKPTMLENNVLYMALTVQPDGTSTVFFTYLKSTSVYSIKSEYLRNQMGSVVEVGEKPYEKQIVLLGTDGGTLLFFRYTGENDIYVWDSETRFKSSNFQQVQRGDDGRLSTQVLSDRKRSIWSLESNFYDFVTGKTGCNGASIILHPILRQCDG